MNVVPSAMLGPSAAVSKARRRHYRARSPLAAATTSLAESYALHAAAGPAIHHVG